jgi:hypothetical protein
MPGRARLLRAFLLLPLACGSAKPGASPTPVPVGGGASQPPSNPSTQPGPSSPSTPAAVPDAAPAVDGAVSVPTTGAFGSVVVSAGDLDRQNSVVSFMFPAGAGKVLLLRDGQGTSLPVQVDEGGRAVFVLPALKAGAQASYSIEAPAQPLAPQVTTTRESDGVKVALGGSTAFRYQMQGKLPPGIEPKYLRGGYLHPILTPSGVLVSSDYPSDHHNAHGIWSAWAPSSFQGKDVNFWAMGEGTGKGDFDALLGTWDGPVHGGVRTRQVQVSLVGTPTTALTEVWVVTLYKTHDGPAPYFLFDLDSTQETASSSPVTIKQHIYGGFAFRGNAQWLAGADFLTSEGKTRGNGDGSTGRWCFIGGKVDGKAVGYAALGHPGNFRAPQPLRINPDDPFFSMAPARAGGFDIPPGKPYVSHFRIVVADGPADRALLDRLWNDYAHPAEATVRGP